MFEASWSTEDGMTSFWTLLVVTLLALTRAQGATAWGTRAHSKADFEQSVWWSSIIFDIGVHSGKRELQEPSGDKRMKACRAQVLDCLVASKEINNLERCETRGHVELFVGIPLLQKLHIQHHFAAAFALRLLERCDPSTLTTKS
jgi:hypothetical protein